MQASEMMYVYSPTSQRSTKSLLLVKELFVACTELTLETSAIHQTSQAKNISFQPLLIKTNIQLSMQRETKFFSKLIFLIYTLKCTTIQAFLRESGDTFDKCTSAKSPPVATAAGGAIFKCSSGQE